MFSIGALVLVAALPVAAQAPQRIWSIGFLHVGDDHVPPAYRPLLDAMSELGYRDGDTVRYDFRNVPNEKIALEAARDLVRKPVDLIVAFDQEACGAAHIATHSVPIVMVHASNPLAAGFAKTLSHPGGNMTGFAGRALLIAKELELLKELAPKLKRALLLFDSGDSASVAGRDEARNAARKLAVTLVERDVSDTASLKAVFARLKPKEVEAVITASYVIRHRFQKLVLQLATEKGIAMIGSRKDVVEQGALFTYAYDFAKVGRATPSRYIVPILRGAKAGELPIEEVTDNELVVNREVANRHGWPLPQSILLRTAQVIE